MNILLGKFMYHNFIGAIYIVRVQVRVDFCIFRILFGCLLCTACITNLGGEE